MTEETRTMCPGCGDLDAIAAHNRLHNITMVMCIRCEMRARSVNADLQQQRQAAARAYGGPLLQRQAAAAQPTPIPAALIPTALRGRLRPYLVRSTPDLPGIQPYTVAMPTADLALDHGQASWLDWARSMSLPDGATTTITATDLAHDVRFRVITYGATYRGKP